MEDKELSKFITFGLINKRWMVMKQWESSRIDLCKQGIKLFEKLKSGIFNPYSYLKSYYPLCEKELSDLLKGSISNPAIKYFTERGDEQYMLADYILHLIVPQYISLCNWDILFEAACAIDLRYVRHVSTLLSDYGYYNQNSNYLGMSTSLLSITLLKSIMTHFISSNPFQYNNMSDIETFDIDLITMILLKRFGKPITSLFDRKNCKDDKGTDIINTSLYLIENNRRKNKKIFSNFVTYSQYDSWFGNNMIFDKKIDMKALFNLVRTELLCKYTANPLIKDQLLIFNINVFNSSPKLVEIIDLTLKGESCKLNKEELTILDTSGNKSKDYKLMIKVFLYIDLYMSYIHNFSPMMRKLRLLLPSLLSVSNIDRSDAEYIQEYVEKVSNRNPNVNFRKLFEVRFVLDIGFKSSSDIQIYVGEYGSNSKDRGIGEYTNTIIGTPGGADNLFSDILKVDTYSDFLSPPPNAIEGKHIVFTLNKLGETKHFLLIDTIMSYLCGAPFAVVLEPYTINEEKWVV